MSANTNAAAASVEPMLLAHLSDAELLTQTRSLVGRSNRLLAELLAHLGEVEARGIHRTRACSSLYTYCIYELRFSEDEAFRRVAASRLVRRFPALLDAIAAGELHLTGLLMLGPHLSAENLAEVIARAKHRTKREIARLVRVLDPLPPVPGCIEPLGPAPARLVPPEPTWEQFVGAMNPVRELAAGERPREWGLEPDGNGEAQPGREGVEPTSAQVEIAAPARVDAEPCCELSAPQLYKVQFTATEEYVRLLDEAKALLSHAAPRASIEEVQLRAMREFVEALSKRKYGAGPPDREPSVRASASSNIENDGARLRVGDAPSPIAATECATSTLDVPATAIEPRRRGRHIPAAIRHAVASRDDHRCTYTDDSGRRCPETRRLEFHHLVRFAVSPSHAASNLTLRCAPHNALAAEEDFGRDAAQQARSATRHDRFGEQRP